MRPDENPEGFLELRNAFEFAKSLSGDKLAPVRIAAKPMQPIEQAQEEPYRAVLKRPANDPENIEAVSRINWKSKISDILYHPSRRGDVEDWEQLFSHKVLSALDEFMDFETELKESLLDFYGYNNRASNTGHTIPETIGKYIFARMDWPIEVNQELLGKHDLNFLHMAMFSGRAFQKADVEEIRHEIEVSETKLSGPIFEALVRVILLGVGLYLIILAFDGVESREQALSILIPASIILLMFYVLIRGILWLVRSRW